MTLNDRMNLLIEENQRLKAEVAELKDQVSILSQRPEFELPTAKSCTRSGFSEEDDENICKCCACGYQWIRGKNGSHSCAEYLKNELDITNSILRERQKLLDAIPECEVHGKCVPHAIEWVESMIQVISENSQLKTKLAELEQQVAILSQRPKYDLSTVQGREQAVIERLNSTLLPDSY